MFLVFIFLFFSDMPITHTTLTPGKSSAKEDNMHEQSSGSNDFGEASSSTSRIGRLPRQATKERLENSRMMMGLVSESILDPAFSMIPKEIFSTSRFAAPPVPKKAEPETL